jgi:molecular chaperone DnaJ
MGTDYYETLGVSRAADAEVIKKAYRQLAMRYHPDRNAETDAEERFKEVTQAYEVLRDPEKRARYDRYGEAGVRPGGAPFGGFGGFADALEVFMREFGVGGLGDMFGGQRARSEPRRGSSLKVSVKVTLAEAAIGVQRTIRVPIMQTCDRCEGKGSEPGSAVRTCPTCQGAGEVRQVQRSMLGQFVSVRPCPECHGEGTRIERPCDACDAAGRVRRDKKIKIDVPAGISSEDYLKLRGRGNHGVRGGPPGDIIVRVDVEPDERFQRRGDDLVSDLPVTFSQAALGAELKVPTIDGEAELTIPPGIQSGQLLRMRAKGMPHLRSNGRGDQLVRVLVWTPTDLSSDQRTALEALADVEVEPPEPRTDDPGFWERVKAAFTA